LVLHTESDVDEMFREILATRQHNTSLKWLTLHDCLQSIDVEFAEEHGSDGDTAKQVTDFKK